VAGFCFIELGCLHVNMHALYAGGLMKAHNRHSKKLRFNIKMTLRESLCTWIADLLLFKNPSLKFKMCEILAYVLFICLILKRSGILTKIPIFYQDQYGKFQKP